MAKRCGAFKPELTTPRGINNYTGALFRCFTKGETLPFRFTFKDTDVTDWKVYIAFADKLVTNSGCVDDQILLEVEIPLADVVAGVFEGEVTNLQTHSLPSGLVYAMAKFVQAPTGVDPDIIPGLERIMDMCVLEVYPNITFPTL